MITPLFLSIPPGTTYQQLKNQLHFVEDFAGVTNWVMRLPRTIYSADLRSKHTFNQNSIQVEKTSNPSLEQRWKYFVITKADGRRYYCTAQVYYQKAPLKCRQSGLFQASRQIFQQFYMPKCLVLISDLPYYKVQVNLLKVYRQLKKSQPIISHSINDGLFKVYLFLLQNRREQEWEHIIVKQTNQSKKVTPSTEFTFNYYISNCNEHKNGEAIFIQKSSNRQVLHLYKLNSQSFYEISYIFHLPFSANTIRMIFSAILQEKQIIFTSNNQNLTTLIIQTFMRMILPLKWCYMYVPNLPAHLIEPAQQSFMPYIVGIHKKQLSMIDTTERCVVFVEEDRFVYQGELYLFHPGLCQYLNYSNTDSKNYLQWEKQIRIKSILLTHTLLEECLKGQQQQQQQEFMRQSTTSLTQSTIVFSEMQTYPSIKFIASNNSFPSLSFIPPPPEHQHMSFIRQFINNSMMYKNFKEDSKRGLTEQTSRLMQIPREHRRGYLLSRFNLLTSQAQYPARFDNEKRWIKYYQRVNRNRRKFRFNRYSLTLTEQNNSIQNSLKMSFNNNSIYASTVRLGQSRVLAQSTIFH